MEAINDPEKTWAVVVGIDQYGDGFIPLKTQVESARRFAKWLIDCGVPSEQISLHLSPRPDPIDLRVELQNVKLCDAKLHTIKDTIQEKIRPVQGGLLYLYWGGHGLLADRERLLFAADASIGSPKCLNLDSLLSALRSDKYSFAQQAIFVDACATYTISRNELSPDSFYEGRPISDREQFVLYSASDDQSATDGAFSPALLELLEESGTERIVSFLENVAERLKTHFRQLRVEGKISQYPMYFSYKPWSDKESVLMGERRFLPLLAEARRLLSRIDMTSNDWRACYRRSIPDWDALDLKILSLERALSFLARPVSGNRIDFLLELLWRIADLSTLRDEDRDLLRNFVHEKTEPASLLRDLENMLSLEKLGAGQRVYLMIELLEKVDSPGSLVLHSWLVKSGVLHSFEPRSCKNNIEDLSATICELISEAEECEQFDYSDKLCLEFFLNESEFSHAMEYREHDNVPIGAKFPATLRFRERLMARKAKAKRWRRLFDEIQARMGHQGEAAVLWVPDDESDHQRLAALCQGKFEHTFLGFTQKQTDETGKMLGECLQAALDYGVPFAFFPRQTTSTAFRKVFSIKIDQLTKWEEFPIALVEMRMDSLNKSEHPAANVGLLWDDPRRMPPQTSMP